MARHNVVPVGPHGRPWRLLTAVRALWGIALLIAPEAVLGELPHGSIDAPARTFARVLGARHLLQASVCVHHHGRRWILAGAAVDGVHAATMAVIAALSPERRKLALTNVAIASALAAAGLADGTRRS